MGEKDAKFGKVPTSRQGEKPQGQDDQETTLKS